MHSHKHLHFLDADDYTQDTQESVCVRACACACVNMHMWHKHTYGCLHALVLTGGCFTVEGSSTLVFISLQLSLSFNFVFTDASM